VLFRRDSRIGREARKVLGAQVALTLAASATSAAIWGWMGGGWALLGGLVCLVPSAWLAARLVRAAEPGRNFGAALLIGELIKVGLVAALFAVLFAEAGEANAPALLLGFVAAVQGYFLAMLFK